VSYGYGGAIASAAYLVYKNAPNNINKLHASLHLIYGIRLCVFLLFRETTIPRFREVRERIEKNSPSTRWKRAPFILQCATLYFLMSLPLVITHIVPAGGTLLQLQLTKAALGVAATGLAINIVGDLHKTIAKARGRSLVTGGLFSLLRHPNYTGELPGLCIHPSTTIPLYYTTILYHYTIPLYCIITPLYTTKHHYTPLCTTIYHYIPLYTTIYH
jgi:steroid 5-alpha reductase family enzyme